METMSSALERARALTMPDRDATLRRDPAVARFWADNRDLLAAAWRLWDDRERSAVAPDASLFDPALRTAVEAAWVDPTTEASVRDLVTEAAPNVHCFQLFDPDRIADLRAYLAEVWEAGIPLRPPYGILLNRGGAMLDGRSEGHLAAPTFQAFYRDVLDRYMRPIARLLFPSIVGFDSQTFGFSINYRPTTETSIRPHTDASSVTLNININQPGEEYTGSTVDFFDRASDQVTSLTFEPGLAMIHRGDAPHAAQPITSGERTNLVLWLMGERGQVPRLDLVGDSTDELPTAAQRWTSPAVPPDDYAPF